MRGKPFSLFKRGKVWYVRFKTADNTFTTTKSTGQTSTINHALSIIKIILEAAEEQSLIRGIPL